MDTVSTSGDHQFDNEKATQAKKGSNLLLIRKVLLLNNSARTTKFVQTGMVCLSFLLMGVVRTAQGPSILDLRDQVKAELQDFKLIFTVGSIVFPSGNLLGAFIIKYFNSLRFLAVCMIGFAVSNTLTAFMPSFATLTIVYGVNELFLGLVDTACNISILQIWGSGSDPFFTALHFCLGIGNLIGPIITECFLDDETLSNGDNMTALIGNSSSFENSSALIGEAVLSPVENDMWAVIFQDMPLTDLQGFHAFLGILLLGASFLGFLGSFLPLREEVVEKSSSFTISLTNLKNCLKKHYLYMLLVGAMTIFAFCGNGIYFLLGNFITVHGLNSPLKMSKSEGARTTAIFFAASVVSKFASIFAVDLIKNTYLLVLLNLFFLSIGSWFLLFVGDSSILLYRIGISIIGLGIGTHFSTGLLWLTKVKKMNNITTSILLIATSVGAQAFKIPASKYIMDFPALMYYITLGSWAAIAILTVLSKVLSIAVIKKNKENIMNRRVIRRESDSSVSSGSIDAA